MNAEEYIKGRLDDQIGWYDRKSRFNQLWFKSLRTIEALAAATIPFLSGYASKETPEVTFAIGALGVIVAVIVALLGLFQFQERWTEYRTTCESLNKEKFLFLTHAEPYNTDDSFALLVQRVESLISKENTNWAHYMMKSEKEK